MSFIQGDRDTPSVVSKRHRDLVTLTFSSSWSEYEVQGMRNPVRSPEEEQKVTKGMVKAA